MSSSVAVTACGQGLSLNQRLAVSNAIKNLKLNEQLQDITFWGKIAGKERDYLIAQSVAVSTKIAKQHFFSHDDGLTFAKLPDLDAFIIEHAPLHKGRFTGNPSLKLRDPSKTSDPNDPDFEEDEEDDYDYDAAAAAAAAAAGAGEDDLDADGAERRAPERRLTEMERLAFAVHRIDHDTCVTPLGAYVMTAAGAIAKNPAFPGLDHAAAAKLSSYGLLRAPALERTLAAIHKMGVANCAAFLDSLAEQRPEGAWALVQAPAGDAVALRSLAWPGFEFKLTVGEPAGAGWGRAYFGTGEPNEDLAFML